VFTVFSTRYNHKIYTENSFELIHSRQAVKNETSLSVKFKTMTAIESFKISKITWAFYFLP